MTDKKCAICREVKPLSDFYLKKSGELDSYCRPCRKEYARRWWLKHRSGPVLDGMRKEAGHGR